MISDGIENCLQYMSNFDPDKSDNFRIFYQTAFIREYKKRKTNASESQRLLQMQELRI